MQTLPTQSRLAPSTIVSRAASRLGVSNSLPSRLVILSFLLTAGATLGALTSVVSPALIDEPILVAVQSLLPSWYRPIGDFCNYFLRDTLTPALWAATVIGLLLVRRNDIAGFFVLAAVIGPYTSLLKQTVDRPRPAGDFNIFHFPTDPSFPSGHALTAIAFFGLWVILAPRVLPTRAVVPVQLLSAAAVFFTGLSRIWAGAHWPSDVFGSLIWGSLFLLLVLMTQPLLGRLNPPITASKTVL